MPSRVVVPRVEPLCPTKIRHRCTITGEAFERVVATVKGAIQPEVLDTIADYVLQGPLEAITDDEVLQFIHKRSHTLVNEFVPDVKPLVRQSLHMDLSMDDCDARVFRYFQDFTRIVEENGLQGLIGKTDPSLYGYRDCMKARCRLLVDNLQPAVPKERLVELECRNCKTDDVALFNLIIEQPRHSSASTAWRRKVEGPNIRPQLVPPVLQGRSRVCRPQSPPQALGVKRPSQSVTATNLLQNPRDKRHRQLMVAWFAMTLTGCVNVPQPLLNSVRTRWPAIVRLRTRKTVLSAQRLLKPERAPTL
jgi:hypothetical protein